MGIFKGRLNDPLRKTLRKMKRHYPEFKADIDKVEGSDKLLAKLERHVESNQTSGQRQLLSMALDSTDEPRRGRVLLNWLWENRQSIMDFIISMLAKA